MSEPDILVAGRYRLVSRIGGGGMGTIWLARDERLGRQVALKQVLPPAGADEAAVEQQRQRALREGRIAARLSHLHAIRVFDVAVEAGSPWLVMEYLPSRSLAEVLHEDGVLRVDEVAQVGAQVADALAATHAAGVVHRDVKPANVLIGSGPDVDGLVKITDFGISHARGDVTLTQTGQITGTPAFLAPEVARGNEMTPASDVFSLGATLYTCLEGQPPFGMDDNALRLLHRVAAGELEPPRRAGSMTGPLLRMLDPDPARRPTMEQVRDELAQLAAGRDGDPTTVLLARTRLRSSTNRDRTAEFPPAAGSLGAAAAPAHPPRTSTPPPRTSTPPPRTSTPPGARPPQPQPAARPAAATPARRRRTPAVAALVLAVLLAGGAALWATTRGDDPGTTGAQPAPASSAAGEDGPGASDTAGRAGNGAGDPDAVAVVEETLGEYYGHLPDDPGSAYEMTGPTLRAAADPAYYEDFWAPWSEVELADVRDAEQGDDGTVTATTEVRFSRADGSGEVELHEVRLVPADDGGWLVDLDRYVETVG
ncbi:serine/threonine-protein kinase [Geodermatophilus sp. SYSU D01105]